MAAQTKFNGKKFRELLLYIASKSVDDPRFGATKLNKILYYADFAAFRIFGQPITGARYKRLSEGPVPHQLLTERSRLVNNERAMVEKRQYYSGSQHRLVAVDQPDESIFSHGELRIVDEVIEDLLPLDARGVSDRSHKEPGWLAASDNQTIPYEMALLSSAPPTPEQEAGAMELAKNLKANQKNA